MRGIIVFHLKTKNVKLILVSLQTFQWEKHLVSAASSRSSKNTHSNTSGTVHTGTAEQSWWKCILLSKYCLRDLTAQNPVWHWIWYALFPVPFENLSYLMSFSSPWLKTYSKLPSICVEFWHYQWRQLPNVSHNTKKLDNGIFITKMYLIIVQNVLKSHKNNIFLLPAIFLI